MNFEAEQACFFPSQIDSNSSLASSLLTKRLKANCFKMGNRNTTLAKKKQTKTKQNKEKKEKKKSQNKFMVTDSIMRALFSFKLSSAFLTFCFQSLTKLGG